MIPFVLAILVPQGTVAQKVGFGHSVHGTAYDQGLRTRPWKMAGIGTVHFPVTTKDPEVQAWFDQGIALLHSFWYEEAERSFRWCLRLDPDCAMAYWGLAQCRDDLKDELKEASKRKANVSERERAYIEAWEASRNDASGNPADYGRRQTDGPLLRGLERIIAKYPEDLEAKAQYAWAAEGTDSAYAVQAVIDGILAVNPMHPGALHAAIHNWDYNDPVRALEMCRRYTLAAPGIGHAQHMPGHNYSKIGMWHEAARSMDAATRVELKYMNDRLSMPEDVWNFPHNRTYLGYIQEQLGMVTASVQGARDLIAAPASRAPGEGPAKSDAFAFGFSNLTRALAKAGRWEDLLKPGSVPWPDEKAPSNDRAYYEALAHAHLGHAAEARASLEKMRAAMLPKPEDKPNPVQKARLEEAEGWTLLAEGDRLNGMRRLLDAALDQERARREGPPTGDPPSDSGPIIREVGDAYLQLGDPQMAIDAYDRSLKYLPNDGYSLAGLAQAWARKGDREKAREYAGRVAYVWSRADPDLKPLVAVRALGLDAKPLAATPAPERAYDPAELASFGPANWQPYAAPELRLRDADGKAVSLKDFRGKNVLVVFYLSDECVHCVEQLQAIDALGDGFTKANTAILAVSAAPPAKNKALGKLHLRLLSDSADHENARRYASYDDFEGMELHSTILIDPQGRVRWKRTGGEPFKDAAFLLKEIGRF